MAAKISREEGPILMVSLRINITIGTIQVGSHMKITETLIKILGSRETTSET